jgi:phosphoribosylamine--glycine ligase
MKVLVIGSGGREHAIAWKLRQDARVKKIFIAPGNAGTALVGENVPLAVTEVERLVAWAKSERPDLTIVGPEAPLVAGVVDAFEREGLAIFGPNRKAAQLEASKQFTKNILVKYGLPTAKSQTFTRSLEAHAASTAFGYPQVIKADGLAAGKGVVIATSPEEAARAIYDMLDRGVFGEAGKLILIEEFLTGPEASLMAVTDGDSFQLLPAAQDHKRIGEGDTGPNTGGMGAYAPAPVVTPALRERIEREIFTPLLAGLKQEGIDYRGILYAGLMLTPEGPKVLEFNVRFGDPECQVLLPLLKTPLVDVAQAVQERKLAQLPLAFHQQAAVGVVLAAANYPGEPRTGEAIAGLPGPASGPQAIFQGGTKEKAGRIVTSGGRVLTVTAWAPDLAAAAKLAYAAVEPVQFAGRQFRRDIAAQALRVSSK